MILTSGQPVRREGGKYINDAPGKKEIRTFPSPFMIFAWLRFPKSEFFNEPISKSRNISSFTFHPFCKAVNLSYKTADHLVLKFTFLHHSRPATKEKMKEMLRR